MAIATVAEIKQKYGYSDAQAQELLDNTLKAALNNTQRCKYHRPWDIVDFRTKLDPKQAWIGFEFETGFDSNKDYQKFINFLWAQDYTAIDREGTGKFPVEVAFAPMHAADVLAGNSTLEAALKFVMDEGLKPALNPTTFTQRDVGCHAGISTPAFRAMDRNGQSRIVNRLNAALTCLTKEQRVVVYNRPELLWGGANLRTGYAEIKTFRAVPTLEAVQKYVRVAGQIVKLMDILIADPNLELSDKQAFAFLSTTADTVKEIK